MTDYYEQPQLSPEQKVQALEEAKDRLDGIEDDVIGVFPDPEHERLAFKDIALLRKVFHDSIKLLRSDGAGRDRSRFLTAYGEDPHPEDEEGV